MKLIAIERKGQIGVHDSSDEHLLMLIEMTMKHYSQTGYCEPWIGYLALAETEPVGVCGFKSAPTDGRVEIAYTTLPKHEGRGMATAMAADLVRIARAEDENLIITAQTLPEKSASTSILTKLGFKLTGHVETPDDGTVWHWELH
ncbi:GNAT family N-acetyltransferase [Aporhodopirellula aestuarii]|uniref:GNAT family N-acetyltransferase n=1 Tax=Aporhodopirellula aestuarii TaxID=2950107 RepID=A0ABT0U3L2_9BACT|nr:GNAT family N-acetyltransferase [Aporhodopirellula aestuarii]MCM2371445.1 GNAT family N-acetyltransferase [Aporhodopirellula aestuarii]